MNDKMYEDMLKIKESRKIVSIYSDTSDTERFGVGYIVAINELYTIVQHISPYGLYDGYILSKTEDIYQISYDGKYESKIQKLYNDQTKKHIENDFFDENLAIALLKIAKKNDLVVSLELHSSGIYDIKGIVLEINTDNVLIEQLTDYGEKDGITRFDIVCITKVACDSDNEQALKMLLSK